MKMDKSRKGKCKKLSPRQKKFVDEFLKSDNATEAYASAYPGLAHRGVAVTSGSRLLKRLSNREDILRRAGLGEDEMGKLARKAIKKTQEKLTAKTTKVAMYQGKIGETLELPDHEVQLKAAAQLLEVTGAFPSRFREQPGDGPPHVNIQVNIPWLVDDEHPHTALDKQSSGLPVEGQVAQRLTTCKKLECE